jgi:hypothetical protein
MNRDTLNSILTGALGVGLVLSVFFCVRSVNRTRDIRRLAGEFGAMNAIKSKGQVLGAVCSEYAKTNTGLDAILLSVNVDPKALRAAAAKPAK